MAATILDLPGLVERLSPDDRARWERIFDVRSSTGALSVPPSMEGWVVDRFGSIEAVTSQPIVHVMNTVVGEGSLFNPLRAHRPLDAKPLGDVSDEEKRSSGGPFCTPLDLTPEDPFGRVKGKHCVTASNIAKYDGLHGLIVFDEHDPLHISSERVADYIDCALAWADRCRQLDPDARNVLIIWNCLWKGGASITHGHAQVVCSKGLHYARVEHLRAAAARYREAHGTDYFDDLSDLQHALGLGRVWRDVRVLVNLTPIKEREVMLLSPTVTDGLKEAVFRVLDHYLHKLGTRAFNLAIAIPPPDDPRWEGFPVVVRLVDRGDPAHRSSDIAAMELYGSSIITTDPFEVAASLFQLFK